ncbi:unnamed protein product [Candida verbasci]|uniref:Histone-lysine N-methyltransferase, H3 lysine-79 specific n=1 Tax=Candida verbasci TaxID=1227364 RepID=A0A9W4TWH5_9ASCO|nr:unnamed protein product [Candida verbasci]
MMDQLSQLLRTPETSDHSGDELNKIKNDQIDDIPHILTEMQCKWNEEDYYKLAHLLRQHISFKSVYQSFYPKYSWDFIVLQVLDILRESNLYYEWVKKISVDFFLRYPDRSIKTLPFRNYHEPPLKYISNIKKFDAWKDSDDDIQEFYCMIFKDLTYSNLTSKFPNKTMNDFKDAFSGIAMKSYSDKELEMLLKSMRLTTKIKQELFLRTKSKIENKIAHIRDEKPDLTRNFPILEYVEADADVQNGNEIWNDDLQKKMMKLRNEPLMYSELIQNFPDFSWKFLVEKLFFYMKKGTNNWTNKVQVYQILYYPDSKLKLLNERVIQMMKEKVEQFLSDNWSKTEIERLYFCIYQDLTKSGLSVINKPLEEIKNAVSKVNRSPAWSKRELSLLPTYDAKLFQEEFIFRNESTIVIQLKKLRKSAAIYEKNLAELKAQAEENEVKEDSPIDWTQDMNDKLLELVDEPVSFKQLMEQLNVPVNIVWEFIAQKVLDSTERYTKAMWLRKIFIYQYNHQPDYEGSLFEVSISFDAEILEKAIDWLKNKQWSTDEIEKLSVLTFTDLTKDNLLKKFPSKDFEELREGAMRLFYHKQPITPVETDYLEEHYKDGIREISENLPTRTGNQIKSHLLKVFHKLNIKGTYGELMLKEGKSKFLINDPAQEILSKITLERTRSEEVRTVVNNNFLEDEDEIESISPDEMNEFLEKLEPEVKKNLEFCVRVDLTKDTLDEKLPSVKDLLKIIKSHPYFDAERLTAGEKDLLLQLVKDEVSLEDCFAIFPLRTKRYISSKYQEFEYISGRRLKFQSVNEQLAYEARMAFVGGSSSSRQKSRKRAFELINDLEEIENDAKLIKPEGAINLTAEEIELKEARSKYFLEAKLKRLEEQRLRAEEQKRQQIDREIRRANGELHRKNLKTEVDTIKETSEYFYTIVGNKQKVEFGQKRQRTQFQIFQPEEEPKRKSIKLKKSNRQLQKQKIKKELRKAAKKRKYTKKQTALDEDEELLALYYHSEEEEEEEEEFINPYDPTDIIEDSYISLEGRQFFIPSIHEETPSLPKIEFVEAEDPIQSKNMMLSDEHLVKDDSMAIEIISSHIKSYKDMPITFPPIFDLSDNINPLNNLKVRTLLYPEHAESYLLAAPKSNELDPIREINKLFQITYSLYFSHSSAIKRLILEEYCQKLETTIEDNDFSEFLFTIDKWNMLMLILSPNREGARKVTGDINATIRKFLSEEEIRMPKVEDLSLDVFYEEIIFEFDSPVYETLENETEQNEGVEIEKPRNLNPTRPDNFELDLLKRLQTKNEISRYTIQQILLRVYARIVSTDTKGLKGYKAFTAQTYGELLPSFTSEILDKLNVKAADNFYDLGSGVGNTTFQAALECGSISGGCEMMPHPSRLTELQETLIQKHLQVFGIKPLELKFELYKSFENNEKVRNDCLDCKILLINNYLFDANLNASVGRLLVGLKPGTKIVSLKNFISPRYRATFDTVFDYLRVERHEMSDILSVSWTANKVPYYISYVEETIRPEYYREDLTRSKSKSKSETPSLESTLPDQVFIKNEDLMTPPID